MKRFNAKVVYLCDRKGCGGFVRTLHTISMCREKTNGIVDTSKKEQLASIWFSHVWENDKDISMYYVSPAADQSV